MRINSIQPRLCNPTQTNTCKYSRNNISCNGVKGALKGAAIGGSLMGGIAFLAIGAPAAAILGGITAGLSAIIGSGFEDSDKSGSDYSSCSQDDLDKLERYIKYDY